MCNYGFFLEKRFSLLAFYLLGGIGVPELQYSSFNSSVTFQKCFTYLIISNRRAKFHMEIKFNLLTVSDSQKVASIIHDFYFSSGDALSINNQWMQTTQFLILLPQYP